MLTKKRLGSNLAGALFDDRQDRLKIIIYIRNFPPFCSAPLANIVDDVFTVFHVDTDRRHHPAARFRTVSWMHIDML